LRPILSTNGSSFKEFARFLTEGLDLLFPPRCIVCRMLEEIERKGMICRPCLGKLFQPAQVPSAHSLWAAGTYAGPLRELIRRAKFSADPLPLPALLLLLQQTVTTGIDRTFDVVTAVPGSPKRIRERGMDLPGVLARRLSRRIGVPYSRTLLRRTRETEAQTSLCREVRLRNLEGVFAAGEDPRGHRILVVDDVVTTGATATAIFEAFPPERRGSLKFAALARTPEGCEDRPAA
jgi:predicted amidophosphoribosyltransferase